MSLNISKHITSGNLTPDDVFMYLATTHYLVNAARHSISSGKVKLALKPPQTNKR